MPRAGRLARRGGGMARSQVTSGWMVPWDEMGYGDAIGPGRHSLALHCPFCLFAHRLALFPPRRNCHGGEQTHEVSGCLDLYCTLAPAQSFWLATGKQARTGGSQGMQYTVVRSGLIHGSLHRPDQAAHMFDQRVYFVQVGCQPGRRRGRLSCELPQDETSRQDQPRSKTRVCRAGCQ